MPIGEAPHRVSVGRWMDSSLAGWPGGSGGQMALATSKGRQTSFLPSSSDRYERRRVGATWSARRVLLSRVSGVPSDRLGAVTINCSDSIVVDLSVSCALVDVGGGGR